MSSASSTSSTTLPQGTGRASRSSNPTISSDPRRTSRSGSTSYNGFAQYGFRAPCAIISPWAKPGYVSHQIYDHTSICALVEAKWNLPAMTDRDANANAMLDTLDLQRPAFLKPPALAKPLLDADPLGALACEVLGPGRIPPSGSVSSPPR
jgi:phospholipase C